MPPPDKFIVGRDGIVELVNNFINNDRNTTILNIYGPGGIGKTEVYLNILKFLKYKKHIIISIQTDSPNLTYDRFLYILKQGLNYGKLKKPRRSFREFDRRFSEYVIAREIMQRSAINGELFDSAGDIIPGVFAKMAIHAGKAIIEEIQSKFKNRYALQEYINGSAKYLSEAFMNGIRKLNTDTDSPIIIVIDTYEKASSIDSLICENIIYCLPENTRVIIIGRDRLQTMGYHWIEYSSQMQTYELPELDREAVYEYYRHHGLTDSSLFETMYEFIGGYPLCMALAVDLAQQSNWLQVAGLRKQVDRYSVAQQLLDRLLQQDGVREVREFLEKGVVTLWFDVDAIAFLLEISPEEAGAIFERISRFSFTSRTEYGLKFHDRVRDILCERLKYIDKSTYIKLLLRWEHYYAAKVDKQWLIV